jgi:hypothetical protein
MANPPVMGIIVPKKSRLLGSEFLNSILVLTNYQVVVAIFLGLAAAVELIELLATEGRIADKATKMVVVAEISAL